jgi:hypothetical protein
MIKNDKEKHNILKQRYRINGEETKRGQNRPYRVLFKENQKKDSRDYKVEFTDSTFNENSKQVIYYEI